MPGRIKLRELMVKIRCGEKDALDEVIRRFTPLINKYSYRSDNPEETSAELIIWLISAIRRYKPHTGSGGNKRQSYYYVNLGNNKKQVPLSGNIDDAEEAGAVAWIVTGLRHEAMRLAQKNKRLREYELLILDAHFKQDEADEKTVEIVDTIEDSADLSAQVAENMFLQKALSLLTLQQKKVIVSTIIKGFTESETANEMNITQQAVHRTKERALNKLRKHLVDKPSVS